MIEFEYTVKNGKLFLLRRDLFDTYVAGLKDCTRGLLRFVRRRGTPKTLEQLGYYYAVILPTIHMQLMADGYEVMGVAINEQLADDIIKHYCARVREGETTVIDKRNMTKLEAMLFLDNVIRWAATTLQCVIPLPTTQQTGEL